MQQIKPTKVAYHQKSELANSLNHNQTTLWIGGLETWEDEAYLFYILQQLLPRYCAMSNITIVRDPTTEISLGYGFIDFASHHAADTALQICRKSIRPGSTRPFRIAWAASNTFSHKRSSAAMMATPVPVQSPAVVTPPMQFPLPGATQMMQSTPNPNDENLTIYVTPLEKHITKFTLAEKLKTFGYKSIVSIKIAHNENGVSRGFGFIRFGNRDEWTDALERLKTLRLGENQQPLHVTAARSNSYDPEHTVANEMLFGGNNYSNYRHPQYNIMPFHKKQRRTQYWANPTTPMPHLPQQPLLDMTALGGPMIPKAPVMPYTVQISQQQVNGIPVSSGTALPPNANSNLMTQVMPTMSPLPTTYMPGVTPLAPPVIMAAPQTAIYSSAEPTNISKPPVLVNSIGTEQQTTTMSSTTPTLTPGVISKPPTNSSVISKPPAINSNALKSNQLNNDSSQPVNVYFNSSNSTYTLPHMVTLPLPSSLPSPRLSQNAMQTHSTSNSNALEQAYSSLDSQTVYDSEKAADPYTTNMLNRTTIDNQKSEKCAQAFSSCTSSEEAAQTADRETESDAVSQELHSSEHKDNQQNVT